MIENLFMIYSYIMKNNRFKNDIENINQIHTDHIYIYIYIYFQYDIDATLNRISTHRYQIQERLMNIRIISKISL